MSSDLECIDTIRTLSIDAVQAANSVHPGTPMALAPLVYPLWNRVMQTRLTSSISVEQPSALNSAPWGVPFSGYHKNMVRPERRVLLTSESLVRVSARATGSRLQPGGEIRPS